MKTQENAPILAERIIESYLFSAEPLNIKKLLTRMIVDCMESDTEYTAKQRKDLIHVYHTLTEFITDAENFKKSLKTLNPGEL